MPDSATVDQPVTDQPLPDLPENVTIPAGDFALICDLRTRVEYAQSQFNAAHEDAKSKKKAYDASRDTFEREFDRVIAKTRGDDLPLFNQTDANAHSVESTGAIPLAARLIDIGKIELEPLVIAGWTDAQRDELREWLDDVESTPREAPAPDPPEFLLAARNDETSEPADVSG